MGPGRERRGGQRWGCVAAAGIIIAGGGLTACASLGPSSGLLGEAGGETAEKPLEAPVVAVASSEPAPPLPERRGKFKNEVVKPGTAVIEAQPVKTAAATGSTEAPAESDALRGLGQIFSGLGGGSESVASAQSPVQVYAALAHGIKRCWLAPGAPRLANHLFEADASTKQGGSAKITIYEKREGARFGPAAFAVTIEPQSGGSVISSENARLPPDVAGALAKDLARWSKGGEGCAS